MKTDMQLRDDVLVELKCASFINSGEIDVVVKYGVVILAGYVMSYAEKSEIERAMQRIVGVKALVVKLEVRSPEVSQRRDADLAHLVKNVLSWMTYLPQDAVQVVSENSWITLSGKVDWEHQKHAASAAVRNLLGVRGVSNKITIKPRE